MAFEPNHTKVFTLPAGTVCHRNGIPFVLQHATQIECHPDNWVLIWDGFQPEIGGQTYVCNQSEQGLDIPQEAQPFLGSATTQEVSHE